jgi:hypothetical protein
MSKARQQSITLTNSISYAPDSQTFDPSITFEIELLHPCRRTTLTQETITDIVYQLNSNLDQDLEIPVPQDVTSNYYSSNADGWATCGARSYTLVDTADGSTPTWVTIVEETSTPGETFFVRVAIDDETYIGTHNFELTIGFVNYPTSTDALHPTSTLTFAV